MSTNINTDINSVLLGSPGTADSLRSNTKSLLIGGVGNDALNGSGNALPQVLIGDEAAIVNLTPRVYTDGLTRFTPTVQITGEITVDGKAVRVLIGEAAISDANSYQTLTTNGTLDIIVPLSYDLTSVSNVQVRLGYDNAPFPAVWNQYQVNSIRLPGTTSSWSALPPNADNDEDADLNTTDQGRFIREGRWVAVPGTQSKPSPIATMGDDWLRGGPNDTLIGGAGNDLYSVGTAGNSVRIVETPTIEADAFNPASHVQGGIDTVSGIFTDYELPTGIEHLEYTVNTQAPLVTLKGNSESNVIAPTGGTTFTTPTLIKGWAGNDTLAGDGGQDTLEGGIGSDLLFGAGANDLLVGDDTTPGAVGGGNDTLFGGTGADVLQGGGGNDMLLEHDADSTLVIKGYFVDLSNPPVKDPTTARTIKVDVLVNDVFATTIDLKLTWATTATEYSIEGLPFSPEQVRSISLRPQPLPQGSPKYDAQIISLQLGEQVQATPSDGLQTAWQRRDNTDVYALRNEYISSNQRFAKYEFNAGTSLNGLTVTNDTMEGGTGDDTYYVDSTGDVIIESASELESGGTDVVLSTINFSSANTGIEEVRLLNVAGGGTLLTGRVDKDDVLIGNQNNNVITGQGGNDFLDGGLGADTLKGGKGSDTFVISEAGDVIENVDPTQAELDAMPNPLGLPLAPVDTIISEISYDLSSQPTIENLTLSGWARNGVGNAKDNVITGNLVSNVLSGGAGNDTLFGGRGGDDQLYGGVGDDTYQLEVFDGALGQATVIELAGEGIDTIKLNQMNYGGSANLVTNYTLPDQVENLIVGVRTEYGTEAQNASFKLTGNDLDNVIESTVNNDTVDAGLGNDLVTASFGQDSLIGGEGNDTLLGEDDNDTLEGGLGNDLLIGGDGDDLVVGGEGDDILVGDMGDTMLGGEGNDTLIQTPLGWSMGEPIMDGGEGSDTYEISRVTDPLNFTIEDTGLNEADVDTLIWRVASQPGELNILALTGAQGATIEDVVLGEEAGAYNVIANGSANVITGNRASNLLDGQAGDDTLYGEAGDTLLGGDGDDTLVLQGLLPTVGTMVLAGGAGSDTYAVNRYDTALAWHFEEDDTNPEDRDTLLWNTTFNDGSTDLNLNSGEWDFIEDIRLGDDAIGMSVTGNQKSNFIKGNIYSNMLDGAEGDDTLDGGESGNDTLRGGAGDDTYIVYRNENTNLNRSVIQENAGAGNDTVIYRQGRVIGTVTPIERVVSGVKVTSDVQVMTINTPANVENVLIDLPAPTDRADIGYRYVINTTDTDTNVRGSFGDDSIIGLGGNDTLIGDLGNDTLLGGADNDDLQGGLGDDVLVGGTGNDTLRTDADGTERLYGGDGIDRLSLGMNTFGGGSFPIGTGKVLLSGGRGGDYYYIDAPMDQYEIDDDRDALPTMQVVLVNGQPVEQWDTATTADPADIDVMYVKQDARIGKGIETMVLSGLQTITGYGDDRANMFAAGETCQVIVHGGGGNDQAWCDEGNDTLYGDDGDDWLFGNSGNEWAEGGTGHDTLDGGLGNDMLIGGEGNDSLIGGDGDDTLYGGNDLLDGGLNDTGVNVLDGGAGNDSILGGLGQNTLIGGAGNDTIRVYSKTTTVKEEAGTANGIDRLEIAVDLGMDVSLNDARWANFENVAIFDDMGARGIIGSTEANLLVGNAFANTLQGGGGNDTLSGGRGDDTLDGGAGIDNLDGGAGDDVLVGNVGETDSLTGGIGNDTYRLYSTSNIVSESTLASGGIDTLEYFYATTSIDLMATTLQGIENAALKTGTAALMKGNALANKLTGGAGNDTLEGGTGTLVDTLVGGAGDDTYRLYSASNLVQEDSLSGGSGIDKLELYYATTAINLQTTTAWNQIENVTLMDTSGGTSVTGNGLDNRLEGNASANRLDGGAGNDTLVGGTSTTVNDTLVGGTGDDVYQLFTATTGVLEDSLAGTDRLEIYYSAPTIDLNATAWVNIENVSIKNNATTTAVVGNGRDNVIEGNTQANKLSGGAGNDTLIGGTSTTVNDTLVGGSGNDVYRVYTATTVVQEDTVSGGLVSDVDTLEVYYNTSSINLSATAYANINHAALKVDTAGTTLTGNGLANRLTGAGGNDTLVGGTSTTALDTLEGGLGNDLYQLYVAGTTVSDTGGAADTIEFWYNPTATLDMQATAAWNGIERATLKGANAANITGNALDNILTGNGANNTLSGGIGNDTLYGGAGADVLAGGVGDNWLDGGTGNDLLSSATGNDIAYWGAANGVDQWTDGGGSDTLRVTGLTHDKLWFTRSGADVVIKSLNKPTSTSAVDTSSITIKGFYAAATGETAGTGYLESIELISSTDTANDRLTGAGIQALVIAMAGKTAPTTGAITNTTALSTVYTAIGQQWT